jgi:hypothetical protein
MFLFLDKKRTEKSRLQINSYKYCYSPTTEKNLLLRSSNSFFFGHFVPQHFLYGIDLTSFYEQLKRITAVPQSVTSPESDFLSVTKWFPAARDRL